MPEYNYPGYGPTRDNILTSRPDTKFGYHGGNDNPAAAGTPVYAEYSGKVFRSGEINGYGLAVVVESVAPNGTKFYELYGHLAPGALPAPGTDVTAGQPINGAFIGTKQDVTSRGGLSTGPHLHREIISGDAPLQRSPKLGFGIFSSDITFKANPDTFDINNPIFPYEHGGIQPAPVPKPTLPTLPNPLLPGGNPPARAPLQFSPGAPIPKTQGPTSIGGPNGPTPLVSPGSPIGTGQIPAPILPQLNFAPPSPPPSFGPFTVPGNYGDSASVARMSAATSGSSHFL